VTVSPLRIGALRDIYHQPLYHTLKSSPDMSGELFFDTAPAHIERLMSNELHAAFINPIDFALNSSDLIISPNVCAASSGMSSVVRLYLRKNLHGISSLAVNVTSAAEVVLARIVLAEKYDSAPVIVPIIGDIGTMLNSAEAALVVGDEVLRARWDGPFLDIIDEWNDVTELPFVHTLCVSRAGQFNPDLEALLTGSREQGIQQLTTVALNAAPQVGSSADDLIDYFSHFTYSITDELRTSLEEFFRMAFYHGMLGDIPEINIAE